MHVRYQLDGFPQWTMGDDVSAIHANGVGLHSDSPSTTTTAMSPWTMKRKQQARRVVASLRSRVVRFADALLERFVCCTGRVSVSTNAEQQPSRGLEPDSEAEPNDDVMCLSDAKSETLSKPQDVVTSATTSPMDAVTAAHVLQRFLQRCIVAQSHATAAQDGAGDVYDSDEEVRLYTDRTPYSSRLQAPQVQPRRPASAPGASIDRSLKTTVLMPPSPTSTSSTGSWGSSTASAFSWRDAHSDIVAENAALRKRLDTTAARVYDFETDPRFMSAHQMRRLAIFRHRDAMRANLLDPSNHHDENNKSRWR